MLDKEGFNTWSGSYDRRIALSSKGYPFEGYYNVLASVQNSIIIQEKTTILDIGIGTGLLSHVLYQKGAEIIGLDFSEGMLAKAKEKMPLAHFYIYELNEKLPPEIESVKFDYIISSYALHHVEDARKIEIINELAQYLKPHGTIYIADVAFSTTESMETVRQESGKHWDDTEFYIVAESFSPLFNYSDFVTNYQQISMCAGVLEIKKIA